jgi:hypothetical protein
MVAICEPTPLLYVGSTSHGLLAAMPDDDITVDFNRTEFVMPFPGSKVGAPSFGTESQISAELAMSRRTTCGLAEALPYLPQSGGRWTKFSVPIGRYTEGMRARIIDVVTKAARRLSRQLGPREDRRPASAEVQIAVTR